MLHPATQPRTPHNKPPARLAVCVALPGEARPLIDHLGAKTVELPGYRAYAKEQTVIVQTGVGKLAAAGSVAALYAHWPNTLGIVNVGLCGSTLPRGSVTLAHTVVDTGSSRRWYPHIPATRVLDELPALKLATYDVPNDHYQSGNSADMEASGILAAATRHTHSGLVQFIKVVSDNSDEPFTSVKRNDISTLTALAIPALDAMLQALTQRAATSSNKTDILADIQPWLIGSTTERHQLQRQLIQHVALTGTLPEHTLLEPLNSGAARIRFLASTLSELAPDYSAS